MIKNISHFITEIPFTFPGWKTLYLGLFWFLIFAIIFECINGLSIFVGLYSQRKYLKKIQQPKLSFIHYFWAALDETLVRWKYIPLLLWGECISEKLYPPKSEKQPIIILSHGYLVNRGIMLPLKRYLQTLGFENVYALNSSRNKFASIFTHAKIVADKIETITQDNSKQPIVFIGFSMGGLVNRTIIANNKNNPKFIPKLCINLASPQKGTQLAKLAIGKNSNEMKYGSQYVKNNPMVECPILNIYTLFDNVVVPYYSASFKEDKIENYNEKVLWSTGHGGVTLSPLTFYWVGSRILKDFKL